MRLRPKRFSQDEQTEPNTVVLGVDRGVNLRNNKHLGKEDISKYFLTGFAGRARTGQLWPLNAHKWDTASWGKGNRE